MQVLSLRIDDIGIVIRSDSYVSMTSQGIIGSPWCDADQLCISDTFGHIDTVTLADITGKSMAKVNVNETNTRTRVSIPTGDITI